jgi:hypothetical protein
MQILDGLPISSKRCVCVGLMGEALTGKMTSQEVDRLGRRREDIAKVTLLHDGSVRHLGSSQQGTIAYVKV